MNCKKEIEELRTEMNERLDKLEKQCVDEMPLCDQQGRLLRAPENGERFWAVYIDGQIGRYLWGYNKVDEYRLKQGSCFIDKISAEKEAERREVIQEIRVLAAQAWHESGMVLDWGDRGKSKAFILNNHNGWRVGINYTDNNISLVYFPSRETAEAAIEKLGERLDVLLWVRGE